MGMQVSRFMAGLAVVLLLTCVGGTRVRAEDGADVDRKKAELLLRVQVNMRNFTEGEQSFRSSFDWFDVSGLKLDSPNDGWMSHIAQPKERLTVSAMATHPAAVSWRLNLVSWER